VQYHDTINRAVFHVSPRFARLAPRVAEPTAARAQLFATTIRNNQSLSVMRYVCAFIYSVLFSSAQPGSAQSIQSIHAAKAPTGLK
jgi:hypothetical protein